MERFDPEQFLALVERYRVTHTQLVPTMFSRMLKLPEDVRHGYNVSSLEIAIHAAAPCPVPVKEQTITRLHDEHGRRCRLCRRGWLCLFDRPADLHDHLRRGQ